VTAHDPRLAALLGTAPAHAAGLAALLASHQPKPPPPPEPAVDLGALLAEARAQGGADGLAAGEARGRAAAEAALAPRLAALDAAAAALTHATSLDEATLAPLLTALAKAICETVLMAELARPRALRPLVEAALAEVADAALPTLSAHPTTLALIAADLPPGLTTAADPGLPPGHVAVTGPDYRVDAGLADRLAQLLKALP
jgi:flagellar assembly protein FliH